MDLIYNLLHLFLKLVLFLTTAKKTTSIYNILKIFREFNHFSQYQSLAKKWEKGRVKFNQNHKKVIRHIYVSILLTITS